MHWLEEVGRPYLQDAGQGQGGVQVKIYYLLGGPLGLSDQGEG